MKIVPCTCSEARCSMPTLSTLSPLMEKITSLEQLNFKISSNQKLTTEYKHSFLFIIFFSSSYIAVGSFLFLNSLSLAWSQTVHINNMLSLVVFICKTYAICVILN